MSKVAPDETTVLHKHPKTREFVQVENSTARDPRLSFKASGLLVHLLSLEQGAKLGSVELAKKRPKQGRVAIQTAYQELREFGYVRQEKKQKDDGTWITITHVYEVPPNAENLPSVPDAGFPASENLPLSLREKEELRKEDHQVFCPRCRLGFPDMDAMSDHYANCGELTSVPELPEEGAA